MKVRHSGSLTVFEAFGYPHEISEVHRWCEDNLPGRTTMSNLLFTGKPGIMRKTFWINNPSDAAFFKLTWLT